jgi:hypothetical protein
VRRLQACPVQNPHLFNCRDRATAARVRRPSAINLFVRKLPTQKHCHINVGLSKYRIIYTLCCGYRLLDEIFSHSLEPLEASPGRLPQCLEASCVSSARGSTFYDRGKQGDVHLGGSDHRLELGEALRGTRHGMVPVRLAVDHCTTSQVRASSRRDPPCMWQAPAHASESFMRGRLLRRLAWT